MQFEPGQGPVLQQLSRQKPQSQGAIHCPCDQTEAWNGWQHPLAVGEMVHALVTNYLTQVNAVRQLGKARLRESSYCRASCTPMHDATGTQGRKERSWLHAHARQRVCPQHLSPNHLEPWALTHAVKQLPTSVHHGQRGESSAAI